MPMQNYLDSEVPEHWVRYIRHRETLKIVWDRRDYTELLDDFDLFV